MGQTSTAVEVIYSTQRMTHEAMATMLRVGVELLRFEPAIASGNDNGLAHQREGTRDGACQLRLELVIQEMALWHMAHSPVTSPRVP